MLSKLGEVAPSAAQKALKPCLLFHNCINNLNRFEIEDILNIFHSNYTIIILVSSIDSSEILLGFLRRGHKHQLLPHSPSFL